jgi:hypothetical protein
MKYVFVLFFSLFVLKESTAQIEVYHENFDSVMVPILPNGWTIGGDPGIGWHTDSTNSSGYTGASGGNNIVIRNNENISGDYELISPIINATGQSNLVVHFGSRVSSNFLVSGSTLPTLTYSIDGGASWLTLVYDDNDANSIWSLVNLGTPIALPADANNQSLLRFKWTIHIEGDGATTAGTYRIDDFSVNTAQEVGTGVVPGSSVEIYPNPVNDVLHVRGVKGYAEYQIRDIAGRLIDTGIFGIMNQNSVDTAAWLSGYYWLEINTTSDRLVFTIAKH